MAETVYKTTVTHLETISLISFFLFFMLILSCSYLMYTALKKINKLGIFHLNTRRSFFFFTCCLLLNAVYFIIIGLVSLIVYFYKQENIIENEFYFIYNSLFPRWILINVCYFFTIYIFGVITELRKESLLGGVGSVLEKLYIEEGSKDTTVTTLCAGLIIYPLLTGLVYGFIFLFLNCILGYTFLFYFTLFIFHIAIYLNIYNVVRYSFNQQIKAKIIELSESEECLEYL